MFVKAVGAEAVESSLLAPPFTSDSETLAPFQVPSGG